MLVAYNLTRWRRACGMTQERLGAELGGWTKGAVSAAERSWDGTRVRKFDADEIADMAAAFHVPIPALFLPPEDDGADVRYVVRSDDGGTLPVSEYFRLLMPDLNWEPDTPAGAGYQQAVITATARYVGGEAVGRLAASVAELAADEEIAEVLKAARVNREAIRGIYPLLDALLEENATLQDALERALGGRES